MSDAEAAAPFRFFDPLADYGVIARDLPHWMQDQTVTFITWRTWDSMPQKLVDQWRRERADWLAQRKMEHAAADRPALLNKLAPAHRTEYYRLFSARWEVWLDDCHGECPLRNSALAKIVGDSLTFFDGVRYLLTDFVVMPNHVHLLAAFKDAEMMLKQCASWKHYMATQINKALNRKGHFWENDAFDHLVRSEEQWLYLRRYIRENPERAKLREGEFLHYSRALV